MGRAIALVMSVFITLLTACDPCDGISACGVPQMDAVGSLVSHLTREPAEGVLVHFQRTGGVEIDEADIVAVSDAEGTFRISADAEEAGMVTGRLIFVPPAPYQDFIFAVDGVEVPARKVRTDRRFLGEWGVGPLPGPPHVSYRGLLELRGTRQPAAGVEVVVRRVSGIAVTPVEDTITTGGDGLFQVHLSAEEVGEVVVDLVVRPPAPHDSFTITGLTLSSTRAQNFVPYLGRWGVGEKIHYIGQLLDASGVDPVAGAAVEFRRTGGLDLPMDTLRVTSDSSGTFVLRPSIGAPGTVTGELLIRPPAPLQEVRVPDLELTSFAADSARSLGEWRLQ